MFNATMITKQSRWRFGNIEQTVSMVLGYNQREGTLSRHGKIWVWILDRFEKDHCIKAIKKDA